jgi:hypothetical protein
VSIAPTVTVQPIVQTVTVQPSGVTVAVTSARVSVVSAGTVGPPGVGVPAGGLAGQVLAKRTGADFDTLWADGGGGVGGGPPPPPPAPSLDFSQAANSQYLPVF